MYSQGKEEAALLEIFKGRTSGKLLDIGAFDGKTFSNTKALIDLGWSGVLVEPSPTTFVGLLRNSSGQERVKLVNALIGVDSKELVEFWDSLGDALSTTEKANHDAWARSGSKFSLIWIPQLRLARLFQAPFDTHYDFINIDTEGTSTKLFLHCLATLPKPKAYCVEHDGNDKQITSTAKNYGYESRYLDGNNIILEKTK